MIRNLLSNMDEDTAARILDNMDDEVMENALKVGIEREIVPHLLDVRERAESDDEPPSEHVRDYYEGLSEDEQTEKFNRAAADVMSVLAETRSSPITGLEKVKNRLRDPWTIEALLLIFDHPDVPDEVVADRKEYAAKWLKYAGVHVIPEVYTREDAMEVAETMYPSRDPAEVVDNIFYDDE